MNSNALKGERRNRKAFEKTLIERQTARSERERLGFEIMAFTFVKNRREERVKPEKYEEFLEKARKWFMKHPNVIFVAPGEGMGWDSTCISLHRSYSDFVQFKREHDMEFSDLITESKSFVANLNPKVLVKPLNL